MAIGGRNTHQTTLTKKGRHFVCRNCACAAGPQVNAKRWRSSTVCILKTVPKLLEIEKEIVREVALGG